MRLVVNTSILKNINFKVLEKEQIVALFEIAELIFSSNTNKYEVSKKMLLALTGLSETKFNELIKFGFITFNNETVEWVNKDISWVKNNKENVRKYRESKKQAQDIKPSIEIKEESKVKVKPSDEKLNTDKKGSRIDWIKVKEMFNTTFKDFEHVSKIKSMDNSRKQLALKVFEYALTQTDPETGEKYDFDNFEDFCQQYFNLCSERRAIKTSWVNKGGNNIYGMSWEGFFFKLQTYKNFTENNKYN